MPAARGVMPLALGAAIALGWVGWVSFGTGYAIVWTGGGSTCVAVLWILVRGWLPAARQSPIEGHTRQTARRIVSTGLPGPELLNLSPV